MFDMYIDRASLAQGKECFQRAFECV